MDLDKLIARLDKQAAAIRDLRDRVATLEDAAREVAKSRHPASGGASGGQTVGKALPPTCLACRGDKEPDRRLLMTCASCSQVRSEGIKLGGDARAALLVWECRLCGEPRKPTTQLVCSPCRDGVKVWVDSQKKRS